MLTAILFSLAVISQDPTPAPAPVIEEPLATAVQAEPRAEEAQAGERPTELASSPRDQQVVCRRERSTGSNRSRNVCTRAGVADYNREAARRWFDNVVDSRGTPEQRE
ncbi:MAG: hypothetical protein REJ23_11795 [Brevundimonas sp.]|nr:hypothetical protein [Brevundimonas sp.]